MPDHTSENQSGSQTKSEVSILKWAIIAALAIAAVGAYLAWGATGDTIRVGQFGLEGGDECSISESFGCHVVHATSFARLLGIPVAWWGFLVYLWVGLMALFALIRSKHEIARATLAAALILSLIASLYSFVKAYHLYELGVICPICVGMYLTNFALVFFLAKALNQTVSSLAGFIADYAKAVFGRTSQLGFHPQPILFLGLTTAFISLGYIGIEQYEDELLQPMEEAMQKALEAHYAQKPLYIEVPSWTPSWGNPEAKIVVVEFSDFQCPACRDAAFRVKGSLFEFRQQIRFYFMNYPIDTSINPYSNRNLHPKAGLAARGGVCADKNGDFWKYHDQTFFAQKEFDREYLVKFAEERGWDTQQFLACIDAEETRERVQSDIELARKVGVNSTPTIFLNGRPFRGWRNAEYTRMAIREELKRLHGDSKEPNSD